MAQLLDMTWQLRPSRACVAMRCDATRCDDAIVYEVMCDVRPGCAAGYAVAVGMCPWPRSFLSRLKIRTFVSLIPEEPSAVVSGQRSHDGRENDRRADMNDPNNG